MVVRSLRWRDVDTVGVTFTTAMAIQRIAPKSTIHKSTWNSAAILNWVKMRIQQNLWDMAKTMLTGTFTSGSAYIRKEDNFQIHHLNSHLKNLEKEQNKHKTSRWKK